MPGSIDSPDNAAVLLRARAEERLRGNTEEFPAMSLEDLKVALHELRVHQVELEMQNEQLRVTQADLEQSKERYASLYDFAPVGYLTLNEPGFITAANLTSTQLLATERARLLGQPFSRFIVKEDQDSFYLCLRKVYTSTFIQTCDIKIRSGHGAAFRGRLQAVRALEHDVPVCHVTLSDVSEQKYAQEVLRENERRQLQYENEERIRLALEAGQLGTWDQDFRTGQILCSDSACAMLGLAPASLVTWQSFVEQLHPDDRPAFLHAAEASTVPGGPGSCEQVFRLDLPNGEVRWLKFAAKCFFDPGPPGKAVRRTGVLADISAQKKAEELLESRAKHLDALVRDRTARLQEAVSELEHFSYTLVHDLRAPLRAIRGYCDLLLAQQANVTPEHREFLHRAAAASERMDDLIRDALNYNKIVRQEFTLVPVDCGALLREMVQSYPQFQEARERIIIEGSFPTVLGNTALLTQCISNLLTNALKFVLPGHTAAVRVFSEELGRKVRICVQDDGIGIPLDYQGKVFEMFQRLNQDYEGTGIGLALVKKAAERMHGCVGVESLPGHGSRFWIELDKAEDDKILHLKS